MVHLTKAQQRANQNIESFATHILRFKGDATDVTSNEGVAAGVMFSAATVADADSVYEAFLDLLNVFRSQLITDVELNGTHVTVWHNAL